MKKEFRLPDVGEGLTEADIVSWHVKPGDTVTINQIIVDIETAKAVVELPSPYAGTVSALLVDEGQTVDVGTPIIAVDVPSADGAEPEPVQPAGAQPQDPPPDTAKVTPPDTAARQPVLVGYGVKPGSTSRRPRKKPPTRPGSYPATPSAPPAGGPPFPQQAEPPSRSFPAGIKLPPGIPAPPQSPGGSPGKPEESTGKTADQLPQPPETYSAPQAPSRGSAPARGQWGRDSPVLGGVTGGVIPPGEIR